MRTLHAPQLPRLQLLVVPVKPNFTATTSHSVVRASYSATRGLPLIMKMFFSLVIGIGKAGRGDATAASIDSPPRAVKAIPDPAAFRKFLREYFIFKPP